MPQPKANDTTTRYERARLRRSGKAGTHVITLASLDGRSAAARRVRETMEAMQDDLGGADNLSMAQRGLVQRAAVLSILCEDCETRWALGDPEFSVDEYLPVINAYRRLVDTLGLERRQCQVGALEWVEQQANERGNGQGRRRTR